jgi:hypothetical protein
MSRLAVLPPLDDAGARLGAPPRSAGLQGSLGQLSVPDLLQTAEANRRSGRIDLSHDAQQGTLWLHEGRVADAVVDGGPRGREAVYEMALWDHGTFAADFSLVTVPERIFEPTSALLLEAMRRRDELLRDSAPLHAAMPDPPPPPPRPLLTVHRALTLLNIAASYAADSLEPALLARRLEESRRQTAAELPVLAAFRVTGQGAVALDAPDATAAEAAAGADPDILVRATARWLTRLFAVLEHALPGRFSLRRLRSVTEAVQEDLATLGFYRELGLSPETAAEPGE